MKKPKPVALIPLAVALVLLLVGYYLDARVIQAMALVIAAILLLLLS